MESRAALRGLVAPQKLQDGRRTDDPGVLLGGMETGLADGGLVEGRISRWGWRRCFSYTLDW